jgi:subtilisin family serine protease
MEMPAAARLSGIQQLEPRALLSADSLGVTPFPEVPYFGGENEWALNSIQAPAVWAQGVAGQGVVVAVIDTGVDQTHRDLQGNIWRNTDEIANNGRDDDHNGFIDDVGGWDFVDEDNIPHDERGHGTHVAGTIAARRNRFGVTGVAPLAKIMPLRVLDASGDGASADIEASIYYAVDNGADVINLSLRGLGTRRFELALRYAEQHDVLVVAAAGNDGAEMPGFPARYSETISSVISVGAYTHAKERVANSNGVGQTAVVQVDGPGVDIFSTAPGGKYTFRTGTSNAAPFVSGVAALAISANRSLSATEVRELLVRGASQTIAGSDAAGGLNGASTVAAAIAMQPSRHAADLDADGVVGFGDFIVLVKNFGNTANPAEGDVDGDGRVQFGDFLTFANAFGTRTPAAASIGADPIPVDSLFARDAFVEELLEST